MKKKKHDTKSKQGDPLFPENQVLNREKDLQGRSWLLVTSTQLKNFRRKQKRNKLFPCVVFGCTLTKEKHGTRKRDTGVGRDIRSFDVPRSGQR